MKSYDQGLKDARNHMKGCRMPTEETTLCPVCELPMAATARERRCSRDEGCPLFDPHQMQEL